MSNISQNSTLRFQFSGAYSIGRSQRPSLNQGTVTPGPQAYHSEYPEVLKKANIPHWKYDGKSDRFLNPKGSQTPGPGQYKQKEILGTAPCTKISIRRENTPPKNDLIGPGRYQVKDEKFKYTSLQYSFSSKYVPDNKTTSAQTPGPGHYILNKSTLLQNGQGSLNQTKKSFKSLSQESISQLNKNNSKQPLSQIQELPGAGTHFQENQDNKKIKYENSLLQLKKSNFAKGERFPQKKKSAFEYELGPGSYSIKSVFEDSKDKRFTLAGRSKSNDIKLRERSPDPATYYTNKTLLQKQGAKFGTSKRAIDVQVEITPGPGKYTQSLQETEKEYQENLKFQNPKQKFFGSASRQFELKRDPNPGPGQYYINKPLIINQGSPIMLPSNSTKQWNEQKSYPGPGQYNIQNSQSGIGQVSMGHKIKSPTNSDNFPGPGQYDIKNKIGEKLKGPKFANVSKYHILKSNVKNYDVGPGSYEIKSTIAGMPDYLIQNIKLNRDSLQ